MLESKSLGINKCHSHRQISQNHSNQSNRQKKSKNPEKQARNHTHSKKTSQWKRSVRQWNWQYFLKITSADYTLYNCVCEK